MLLVIQPIDVTTGQVAEHSVPMVIQPDQIYVLPTGCVYSRRNPWRDLTPVRTEFTEWQIGDKWFAKHHGTGMIYRIDVIAGIGR